MRGLWVTIERDPAKSGGLGEVSKTIPMEMNRQLGLDIRVIVPALKPLLEQGDWTDTGEVIMLSEPWLGPDARQPFRLLQKFEPDTQTWVYAVSNEKYFDRFNNVYFPGNWEPSLGDDPIFKAVMVFNRAAVQFALRLEKAWQPSVGSRMQQFDGLLDFVMVHDWLTSPFLQLLPAHLPIGKIFMLHNTYDAQRHPAYAAQVLDLPKPPLANTYQLYSPLESGVANADVVIANQNYVRSITAKQEAFDFLVKNLWEKMAYGKLFDMHHGIDDAYDPFSSQSLETDGFTTLKIAGGARLWCQMRRALLRIAPQSRRFQVDTTRFFNRRELIRYKRTNKRALQQIMGLEPNEDAIVFSFVGRFDPIQKGFYLLMNEARALMDTHRNIQFIIAGANSNGDYHVGQFIEEMNADPRYKGRIYIQDQFVNRRAVIRIYAGSDFFIMPSLYEPFGLAQLEAMKLGAIPIAHGVDGIRSTVSDPIIDRLDPEPRERVWEYGQVGVKIELLNVPIYHRAITDQVNDRPLDAMERWVLDDSQRKFKLAMDRAIRLGEDPARRVQIIQNGMRYVAGEHTWSRIIQRYDAPVKRAVFDAHMRVRTHSSLK
jgi:glycogen synthase